MSQSRLREAHVPILLWLPAAAMLHLGGGSGAMEAAESAAGKAAIQRFSRDVRRHVTQAVGGDGRATEIEVFDETTPLPPPDAGAPSPEPPQAESPPEADPSAVVEAPRQVAPKPEEVAKPKDEPRPKPEEAAKPKDEPKPKPEEAAKPKDEPKPPEAPPTPPAPPPPPTLPNGRIAVENDPDLDKNQPDNPNADKIADHANKTEQETQAAHRSYDQNASKPDGGGAPHKGEDPQRGNADEDERGHSVEAKGEGAPKAGTKPGAPEDGKPASRSPEAPEERVGRAGVKGEKSVAPVEGGKGTQVPEAVSSGQGEYSIDPDGGDGRAQAEARAGKRGRKGQDPLDGMILPGKMPSRYGIDAYGLRKVLGEDNLRAEAERARNVRLDKHRGTLASADFKKYRAAIENYVPLVKEGNQTSLNAARVPFASFINRMHNQIHPIFADGFLRSLDGHPDPRLQDMKIFTHVEIILDGATGKLLAAGVVRPSGVTALEVAALRALEEASPYGKAPDAILSPDGRVYLHWEFYRDPYFACTSQFARPYLLKADPKGEPEPTPPPPQLPAPSETPKYGSR